MTGHTGIPASLASSPDGKYLASAAKDNTVKVWDMGTGEELATLYGEKYGVQMAAYNPNGTRIASTASTGTFRTFVVSTEELMEAARSRVTRSLTAEECQKYLHLDECPEQP